MGDKNYLLGHRNGGSGGSTSLIALRGGAGGGSRYTADAAGLTALRRDKAMAGIEDVLAGEGRKGDQERISDELSRLLLSTDPKAREVGSKILSEYSTADQERLAALGVTQGVPEDTSVGVKLATAADEVMRFIDRPRQALNEVLQQVAEDTGLKKAFGYQDDGPELGPAAYKALGISGGGGYRDAITALAGNARWDPTTLTMDKNTSFTDIFGVNPEVIDSSAAGRVLGGADFVGGAAVDPLNFAGGGARAVAGTVAELAGKQLAKEVTEEALTPALRATLKRMGVEGKDQITEEVLTEAVKRTGIRKALTAEQRTGVEALVRGSGTRSTSGVFSDTVRELAPDAAKTEKHLKRMMSSADRYDRGGLRFAGRSLPGAVKDNPLRRSLFGDTKFLGLSEVAGVGAANRDKAVAKLLKQAGKASAKADELAEAASETDAAGELTKAAKKALSQQKRQATRAANLTAKADALEAANDAQEILAISPELADVNARLRVRTPGLISDSRPVSWMRTAFSPRAALRRSESLPLGMDQTVYRARNAGSAISQAGLRDGARRLEAAAGKIGALDDTQRALVRDLLEAPEDAKDAVRAQMSPELAQYADDLDEVRQMTYDAIEQNALARTSKLRDRNTYLMRSFTPEGLEAIKKAAGTNLPVFEPFRKFNLSKAIAGQEGTLLARQLDPDLTIAELIDKYQPALEEAGFLKPGARLMETDPAVLIAKRHEAAMRSLDLAKFVDGLEGHARGLLGEKLVIRKAPGAKGGKKGIPKGMQEVNLGDLGTVYAHPEIAPEITKYFSVIQQDESLRAFANFATKWQQAWKAYATVPVLTGSSFHVKNSIGNMFNNFLAGVNPQFYGEATRLQTLAAKARREFPDMSVPDAIEAMGGERAAQDAAKIELALERQVLDEGFFSIDIADNVTTDALLKTKSKRGQALAKVDPRNPSQMLGVPTGRKIGEAIEDNARLTHFLSKLDEFGDADLASDSVKRYLFDYNDLTGTERMIRNRIHAFYTFTRKNTPLQFQELVRNPAAFNKAAMAEEALLGGFGQEDSSAGVPVPGFMGEIGGSTGTGVAGWLGGQGNPMVANIETPFDAATETASPLINLASGDATLEDTGRALLRNTSGGPAEALKLAAEYGTGNSLFTGGSLTDPEGDYKENPLVRISGAALPVIPKAYRLTGGGSSGNESAQTRAIRALTGVRANAVTDERQDQGVYEDLEAIRALIERLRAQGVEVPTLEELQTLGLAERPVRGR